MAISATRVITAGVDNISYAVILKVSGSQWQGASLDSSLCEFFDIMHTVCLCVMYKPPPSHFDVLPNACLWSHIFYLDISVNFISRVQGH